MASPKKTIVLLSLVPVGGVEGVHWQTGDLLSFQGKHFVFGRKPHVSPLKRAEHWIHSGVTVGPFYFVASPTLLASTLFASDWEMPSRVRFASLDFEWLPERPDMLRIKNITREYTLTTASCRRRPPANVELDFASLLKPSQLRPRSVEAGGEQDQGDEGHVDDVFVDGVEDNLSVSSVASEEPRAEPCHETPVLDASDAESLSTSSSASSSSSSSSSDDSVPPRPAPDPDPVPDVHISWSAEDPQVWQVSASGDRLRLLGTVRHINCDNVKLQCKLHKRCGMPLRIVDNLDTIDKEIDLFFKFGATLSIDLEDGEAQVRHMEKKVRPFERNVDDHLKLKIEDRHAKRFFFF